MDTPTGNGSASAHAAISPRPIGAATRTRATAVPRHGRDPPSRHLTGVGPPPGGARRPPPRRTRPGPSRTAADTAGSLQGARADGPGESRTRGRSHAPVPRRGRSSVRVPPAGRTVKLCFAGVPEHLAERQAHEYCDHGPDEETARDPQDPHISSKAPGRRVVALSRLAWMQARGQVDHPGERGTEGHACGDGLRTTARQQRPIVIPLVPVLWRCGGRGLASPVDCLIDQDTAQLMKTSGPVLWTLARTADVQCALESAVGAACTQPCRCDYP